MIELQTNLDKILLEGLSSLEIDIDDEQKISKYFKDYMDILLEYNSHTNLTAITEPQEVYIKHFIDSSSALVALNSICPKDKLDKFRYIDIGAGAGFPSMPIKILREEFDITMVDSLEKRTRFLNLTKDKLNLSNLSIVHSRAEDLAKNKDYRENFDIALSRAVANLPVLLEYSLPFVKLGGHMICLKGPLVEDEIANSQKALKILGGKVVEVMDIKIPYSELNHKILIIKKVKKTDKKYPRKAGTPSKEPLV